MFFLECVKQKLLLFDNCLQSNLPIFFEMLQLYCMGLPVPLYFPLILPSNAHYPLLKCLDLYAQVLYFVYLVGQLSVLADQFSFLSCQDFAEFLYVAFLLFQHFLVSQHTSFDISQFLGQIFNLCTPFSRSLCSTYHWQNCLQPRSGIVKCRHSVQSMSMHLPVFREGLRIRFRFLITWFCCKTLSYSCFSSTFSLVKLLALSESNLIRLSLSTTRSIACSYLLGFITFFRFYLFRTDTFYFAAMSC